ncbi:hypothetical protein F5X96DRAFT_290900 [Biscogniauxia mediterranea]|nr:hypothetical protein F5X96DRAFT_290900 [Biscogniauxia mediterranea]
MMSSKLYTTLTLLGASSLANAFWRMECRGVTGYARIDPLVNPDEIAAHAHTVHGSSGFGMDADYDALFGGNCSSCIVKQDKSAYWTPILYFKDSTTGEFEMVPQVGGMLAYYFLRGDNIEAFQPGFQMLAGDTNRRNYTLGDPHTPDPPSGSWESLGQTTQDALAQRAIGFNCLNYLAAAEGSLYRHYMPTKSELDAKCLNGTRIELAFPSCWNGELDSDDHKSHVAYPDMVTEGDCPDSHPRRLPSLFYETIWATNDESFVGRTGEYFLSNGDPTGYGYHGDFMNGWDEDFLQSAIDQCTNLSGRVEDCSVFTNNGPLQTLDEMTSCKFEMPSVLADEDCATANLTSLPGNVQIQYGPQPATAGSSSSGSNPFDQFTSFVGSVFNGGGATATSAASSSYSVPTLPPPSGTPSILPTGAAFIETSSSAAASEPQVGIMATSALSSSTAAPPAPTSAPAPTSEPGVSYEVASTQTITTGELVEEIVWMEPVVYVTEDTIVTTTVGGPAKRSQLRRDHALRHRHHGHH